MAKIPDNVVRDHIAIQKMRGPHGPFLLPPCVEDRGQDHCWHPYELVHRCCWCGMYNNDNKLPR